MEKIVISDTKTDMISTYKKLYPYTYMGMLKEFIKTKIAEAAGQTEPDPEPEDTPPDDNGPINFPINF